MFVQSDDFPKTSPTDAAQPAPPPANGDGAQPDPHPEPQPEAQAPADDLETLRAELAEIEQKADEYLRLAQRTQADFVNYRRRVEEERLQQASAATLNFVLRLLPVIDDFERVMANAAPAELESSWGK